MAASGAASLQNAPHTSGLGSKWEFYAVKQDEELWG
jgi:hypothetical protein